MMIGVSESSGIRMPDLHPVRPCVYLDQWVWIRLAKAANGQPREATDLRVLAAVQDAAAEGVAFPLSTTHHIETSKVTSARQRLDVARTMASISHCRTLRARKVLLRHQMRHAMHLTFGRPACRPQPPEVLGTGFLSRGGGRRGLAVGAIDETSPVKQGERTAGVKRHYLGCAGKVANGITTVHLAYAREGIGHALIAARQWIPREQLEDPARRRVMRLPPDLAFRTKGQLAIDLIGEVLADGIGLDFACGDEVYGRCTQLREYLEARGLAYVLRVPSNFYLTAARGVRLTCKQAAATLLAARRGWEVRSAGTGAKGQRWYAWAWLGTASPQHYLLIRRHLTTGELAFHYCFVPAGQPVSLTRLVRAAGCRWPVEEDFRSGKGCFGLDESQVRLFTAIARHTALVMAALAICAVTAALLRRRSDTRAPAPVRPDQPPPADPGLIPLTVRETARLLAHPPPPGASRHWLAWRRRHQALSAWYHQRTRLARDEHVLLVS
jgi:SRSO17 transposase